MYQLSFQPPLNHEEVKEEVAATKNNNAVQFKCWLSKTFFIYIYKITHLSHCFPTLFVGKKKLRAENYRFGAPQPRA